MYSWILKNWLFSCMQDIQFPIQKNEEDWIVKLSPKYFAHSTASIFSFPHGLIRSAKSYQVCILGKAKKITYLRFAWKCSCSSSWEILFFNRKDVQLRLSSQQVCLQYYDEAFTIFLAWSKEIMQKGRRGFRPEWMLQKFCTKEAFSFEKSIGIGWTRVKFTQSSPRYIDQK